MRTLQLSWIELKLFAREPLTVVFSLALPVFILVVLGGVFGDQPTEMDDGTVMWRGVGAMSYYVPAYLALVVASVCIISIPTHLAGNRERGVLKRFRASSISAWEIAGSQVAVALVLSVVSGAILLAAAAVVYDFDPAQSVLGVVGVLVLLVIGFSALGIFLGAILPTARSAQAVGLLIWFVMLQLGGAGPPREVLTEQMRAFMDFTPMWHAVRIIQEPWLGLDAGWSWLIFGGIGIVSAILAMVFFRWE